MKQYKSLEGTQLFAVPDSHEVGLRISALRVNTQE